MPSAESQNIVAASQLAIVSRSADRVARARSYAHRLGVHAEEIRTKLDALAGGDGSGPLRGELVELDRQHRQATAALAAVEVEHARHAADLAALHGSDGAARVTLADAHRPSRQGRRSR